ncbi:MAG TPA: hypothetical protein VFE98_11325 [Candidatus Bathyarchaeia archaeon]|nr:hypothetical protein [Candidatus Bathyarchaeia archaeon]
MISIPELLILYSTQVSYLKDFIVISTGLQFFQYATRQKEQQIGSCEISLDYHLSVKYRKAKELWKIHGSNDTIVIIVSERA